MDLYSGETKMAKTGPVRFKRVAAAFNEASRATRLCESSGSEHCSPDSNSADLSDLVNSFIEREYADQFRAGGDDGDEKADNNLANQDQTDHNRPQSKNNIDHLDQDPGDICSFSETKDMLESLLGRNEEDGDGNDRQKIRKETEIACGIIGERSSLSSHLEFKRGLMSHLRERGFDAGLCKSKWDKFGRHPAGNYEYVDVNVSGKRYIVEVFLAGEFIIARPTSHYTELLQVFPRVYIGNPEEVKKIVRLMCNAMRESMKGAGMPVAPWRRYGYMNAKWSGHYKRTTNEVSSRRKGAKSDREVSHAKRVAGFEPLPVRIYHCKDDLARKGGSGVSHLTAAFRSDGIDI
ncbi:hypothetical protein OIU84_002266 [Salix udensis]|uniref:DUF506 family protein n=1 Tax=Salix udensis TaxID=889485 RepID=A0AAD6K3N1_9ROSI|nr:hypothetical protein OIU84_002266 [Salix udensis]